jgi:hypothetical protein
LNISYLGSALESLYSSANTGSGASTQEQSQAGSSIANENSQTTNSIYLGSNTGSDELADLISKNFEDSSDRESKYISAQLKSHKVEKTFQNKINSLVGYLSAGVAADNKYTQAMVIKAKAEKYTREIINSELNEEFEKQLEDSRDRSAEKVEEGAAQDGYDEEVLPETADGDLPETGSSTEFDSATPDGEAASVDITV